MRGRAEPKTHYDIVVVGGGVYGAAHAWEAACAGLSTLLVEREDYCSGASANSLKTIHGGVRYLQNFDFRRVRESKREQSILLNIAPHLIRPLACVMPTDWSVTRNPLAMWLGFALYKWIGDADITLPGPYRILGPSVLQKELPGLVEAGARGAAVWYDAQVYNSERLVIDYLVSAQRRGADVYNYRAAETIAVVDGRVKEVTVRDRLSRTLYRVQADAVVDTTGGWAAVALEAAGYRPPARHGRVRAVNLLFSKGMADYALAVKSAPDAQGGRGRLLFAAPWRDHTIVGTWYFPCSDSVDKDRITREEFEYCLADVRLNYAGFDVTADDVSLVHVGTLPTENVPGAKGDYDKLLDKQEIVECGGGRGGPAGMWIVPGIKYTTARAAAEHTIRQIQQRSGAAQENSATRVRPLRGGDFSDRETFRSALEVAHGERCARVVLDRLVDEYGTTAEDILRYAERDPDLAQIVPGTRDMLRAEVLHAIEVEQAVTVSDVLIRRAGVGAVGKPDDATVLWCADFMARHLSWDGEEKKGAIEGCKAYYARIVD